MRFTSMSKDCAVMPPTTTDHEVKSPARRHSIDDILAKDAQMYSGSDSSSESSGSSPPSERDDGSPPPPLEAHQTIITTQSADAAAVVVALQQSQMSSLGGEFHPSYTAVYRPSAAAVCSSLVVVAKGTRLLECSYAQDVISHPYYNACALLQVPQIAEWMEPQRPSLFNKFKTRFSPQRS